MQPPVALFSVLVTVFLYLIALVGNEWLFANSEYIRGINWIYLPAGVRLLGLLLFGGWGAAGILAASWLAGFFYYFPDEFLRPFAGGLISAGAPFLVYKLSQQLFGLQASLINLDSRRLLICVLAYAFTSPLLHHLLFISLGTTENLLASFTAMFIGDLLGTLIVIYVMKMLLSLLPAIPATK